MNIEQACKILDDEKVRGAIKGKELLQKANNPSGTLSTETVKHNKPYTADETLPNMTEDDVKQMAKWGWSLVEG